jgi:hypothetical protein
VNTEQLGLKYFSVMRTKTSQKRNIRSFEADDDVQELLEKLLSENPNMTVTEIANTAIREKFKEAAQTIILRDMQQNVERLRSLNYFDIRNERTEPDQSPSSVSYAAKQLLKKAEESLLEPTIVKPNPPAPGTKGQSPGSKTR